MSSVINILRNPLCNIAIQTAQLRDHFYTSRADIRQRFDPGSNYDVHCREKLFSIESIPRGPKHRVSRIHEVDNGDWAALRGKKTRTGAICERFSRFFNTREVEFQIKPYLTRETL